MDKKTALGILVYGSQHVSGGVKASNTVVRMITVEGWVYESCRNKLTRFCVAIEKTHYHYTESTEQIDLNHEFIAVQRRTWSLASQTNYR